MTQQPVASADDRIDVAHAPDFCLGPALVRASLLEIQFGNRTETVERRVMQLLVALIRAGGAPVSRDELIECCWEGLIVSDDAINQSVSKLRRALAGIPGVTVTSVHRVGYRIIVQEPSAAAGISAAPKSSPKVGRVVWLVAVVATVSVLAFDSRSEAGAGRDLAPLFDSQAGRAVQLHDTAVRMFRERSRPGYAEAERLLRHAVALDPKSAPSWARLSMTVYAPWWWATEKDPGARARLRSEAIGYARRSLALDPNLAEAHQAMGFVLWDAQGQRHLERAALLDPNDAEIRQQLADLLEQRLELRRALAEARRGLELEPTSARGMATAAGLLGRLGYHAEADAVIERMERLTHRSGDARRARFLLKVSQGRLADAAAQCSRSLKLGDEDAWWPQACLIQIADALDDRELVADMLRTQPRLVKIIPFHDPGHAVRLGRSRPNDWWADVFVGALARQLVASGNDDLLLSLFDDRYETADQLWNDQRDRADMVAPSLILALKRKGRTDEAAQIRARWLADIEKMRAEGDTYFRVPVWSAQVAALDGDAERAAHWLNLAVNAGWKGYGQEVLAFPPGRDPIFGLVASSPEMRAAIHHFGLAAARESKALKTLDLASAAKANRFS